MSEPLELELTDEELTKSSGWGSGWPMGGRAIANTATAKAAWEIVEWLISAAHQDDGAFAGGWLSSILEAQGIQKPTED